MEEKKFTIYLHRCPNGKCYVGMTSQNINRRWRSGLGYQNNKDFYSDIKIYGWDNIEHIILEEGLSRKNACESEKYNIKKYNCIYPNGYNISIGGDISYPSESGRIRISESAKKRIGEKNSFYGRHHTDYTKKLLAKKANERYKTKEIKEKISLSLKEYYKTHDNPKKGKQISDKQRMTIDLKKEKINQYNIYGNYIKTFDSLTEISIKYNISVSAIIQSIKRDSLSNNFRYRYFKDNKKCKDINPYIESYSKGNVTVADNYIFIDTKKCGKYLGTTLVLKYLNGIRPMPQKYIDRGLRYYNPETDSHLQIYVDTKDEV